MHLAYLRKFYFRGQFFTAFVPAVPDQFSEPVADLQVFGHGIGWVDDSHEKFLLLETVSLI